MSVSNNNMNDQRAMDKGGPRHGQMPIYRGQAGRVITRPTFKNALSLVLSIARPPLVQPFVHSKMVKKRPLQAQNVPVHSVHSNIQVKIICKEKVPNYDEMQGKHKVRAPT